MTSPDCSTAVLTCCIVWVMHCGVAVPVCGHSNAGLAVHTAVG